MKRLQMVAVLVAVAAALLSSATAEAQIYVIEDADGNRRFVTHYQPGAKVFMPTVHTRTASPAPARSLPYRDEIVSEARAAGLEPLLVEAVIAAESNFDPFAVSRKGAQGLMQLMPGTAQRFRVRNVWDPTENIRGGVAYLKELMGMFDELPLVLAAYNAGEGAVTQYGGVPPYAETRTYVNRVLGYYRERGGQ